MKVRELMARLSAMDPELSVSAVDEYERHMSINYVETVPANHDWASNGAYIALSEYGVVHDEDEA